MKQRKYVTNFVKSNDKKVVNYAFIIYYVSVLLKDCRKCRVVLAKHKRKNEQNVDVVLELKQYCHVCQKKINLLAQRVDKL